MARKQKAEPVAVPVKKSAKATKASKSEAPAAAPVPATKASKKAATKPEPAKRTNAKHEAVSDETVLKAFDKHPLLGKKELVAACGGDDVAVTKAVNRLRGIGKIVVRGSTRSAVYSRAA
jgi:hypothetical protein